MENRGGTRQWEPEKEDILVFEEINDLYYNQGNTWDFIGHWYGVPPQNVRIWFRLREQKRIKSFNRKYWGIVEKNS